MSTCKEQPSGQDNEDDLKHDRVQGNQPSIEKDDETSQWTGWTAITGQEGEQIIEQDKDL